ncbi:1-acyl-sn-glycerol-3-phosphate acyltransferase [Singulisphaera sp. GP187]|uniref:lysophospholipid acyltransferase family protein n=1 Tax=Singulisphaera sp. GP187 TaxID=1882752 RepID=UPI000926408C|nr:lysophospholipid acyltransferase family protein [Singulisphaera sp. GP187]SIO27046.1 1-acyl-sn-glycerol-3-phosphate acyltransferase [Singulisphaera sp. GP187]
MDPWNYKPAAGLELPPVELARSLQRESGLASDFWHHVCHRLSRVYFRLYHRMHVEGAEHLPKEPPFILIANHSSHLDALALASALPRRLCGRVFPVAAGDVFFETPVTSIASALILNALPMWRKRCGPHALAELRARLIGEPCGFILFPEGTRSRDGQMQAFKAGLGMLIAGTAVPIVPCHLTKTFEAFPPGARLPRPRKIQLKIGPPLHFDAVPNAREGWQQVVSEAEAAVRRLAAEPL